MTATLPVVLEDLPAAPPAAAVEVDEVARIDAEITLLSHAVPSTLAEAVAVETKIEELHRRRDTAKALVLALAFDRTVLAGMARALGLGIPLDRLLLVDHTVPGRDPEVPASWGRGATVCFVKSRDGRKFGIPLWRARVAWFGPSGEVSEADFVRGFPVTELRVIGENVTGGGVY